MSDYCRSVDLRRAPRKRSWRRLIISKIAEVFMCEQIFTGQEFFYELWCVNKFLSAQRMKKSAEEL
jgi:hypothetical protein